MPASREALRILYLRLGQIRGPTKSGWIQANHKDCGDTKFRLGLKFADGRAKCFHCGFEGAIEDVCPGLPQIRHVGRVGWGGGIHTPPPPDPSRLPWKPIKATGEPRTLEKPVVEYLLSRGVPRARAASLGLGYGTLPPYSYCAIHPWLRPNGTLGGWQARRIVDPDDGSPKIIHAKPRDWPGLYSPAHGGMFCFELVPEGADLLLVEGPYDTYSGLRVMPTAGLMGSELYDAQLRRILSKHPRAIYYGLDLDTHAIKRNAWSGKTDVPKARKVLSKLYRRFDGPLFVLSFAEDFGDLGGWPDKTPHTRREVEDVVSAAERWNPAA